MKKVVFIFIVIFSISLCNEICAQRLNSGIYFLSNDVINCSNILSELNYNKTYCVGNAPIISCYDFKEISDIYYGINSSLLEIKLTSTGQQKLKVMQNAKIDIILGLVIYGKLFTTFEIKNTTDYSKIVIYEKFGSLDLVQIRNSLKTIIENK
ncbi:MAG: hypothetical protein OEX22_05645 [Cyclobacteriaceae bacterium]|nr:hypothetical protein [Cyclobacteriaceae bacterium]